jgi:hypothetical protein
MGDSDPRPTVQRTLVKSPPELWADLSDPESLGKRLGEFGEIRITRLVPEKTVVWEGERASGTVEIESSGWGTKVRLSARATGPAREEAAASDEDLERERAVEAALRAEVEREAAIEAALLAELEAEIEREVELKAQLRAEAEAEAASEAARLREIAEADRERQAELAAMATPARAAQPERGFFSRFRRRRKPDPTTVAPPAPAAKPPVAGPRPTSRVDTPSAAGSTDSPAKPFPAKPPAQGRPAAPGHRPPVRLAALAFAPAKPKPADQASPRLADSNKPAKPAPTLADFDKPGAETITASRHPRSEKQLKPALDDEQTLAVLAGVLDDLGAAHHRPFSRDRP